MAAKTGVTRGEERGDEREAKAAGCGRGREQPPKEKTRVGPEGGRKVVVEKAYSKERHFKK